MGPESLEAALKDFDKKFKDKSGHKWEDRGEPAKKGKYTFIEKSYEDDSEDEKSVAKKENEPEEEEEEEEGSKIESKLPKQTQRLIELIFNQNHFNSVLEGIGYNAEKLPLGKLSKATLKQGFDYLNELASLIKHPKLADNKHHMTQKEVSLPCISCDFDLFYRVLPSSLTHIHSRPSKNTPTSTTPQSPMILADVAPSQSTTKTFSALKSPCSTPSPTWKLQTPS